MEKESFEDLLDLFNKKESKKRRITFLILAIVIIAGVVFTGIAISKIFHVEKKSEEITVAKDSLEKVTQEINIKVSRDDSAKKIVLAYLNRKNLNDESIAAFFIDTVERYFRKEKISRYDLIKEDRKFWKKFPDEVFKYDSNFSINVLDSINTSVMVNGTYSRAPKEPAQNMIEEIKLDKDFKIYYVRAFLTEK
jgi:hypothetical protein